MLVDGIRCRQTEAVWKVDEVSKRVKVQRVIGINDSVPARVGSRELLIALKLHSGRDPDLRDVVMLTADADWLAVLSLANRGSKPKVKYQLEHELKMLSEPDFENRLKAYFGSRQNESKRVNTAAARIRDLLKKI